MSRILGTNKRCYPREFHLEHALNIDLMNVEVTVVLVEGEVGDYAAYVGSGSPDWIAENGDKISFEEACVHFPGGQLKKELYRS